MTESPLPATGSRRPRRLSARALLAALALLTVALAAGHAAAAQPEGTLLQLGLFQKEGEAWWAWQSMQRREPALAQGLTPKIVPLDAKRQGGGVALRAGAPASVDAKALCRRMLGAGFGCLVLDEAVQPAASPAPAETPAPAAARADGAVAYGPDDAKTMAEIEKTGRRKGRLGAVVLGSPLDVTPAVLKRENWNLCALTFDDGPHRTVTRQILDVLNQEKIRATYFPVARVAAGQGDVIRDFVAAGHEIGNHSLTHSDLRAMTAEAQRFEIAEANRILRSLGADPVLFRPPFGRYTLDLLAIARDERMSPVLWTVDTRDWQVRDPDKIVQLVKTEAVTGSVLLLHSTYPSTLTALPRVIKEMRAKGCEFVTLSEWIARMRHLATPQMVNAGEPAFGAGTPAAVARP